MKFLKSYVSLILSISFMLSSVVFAAESEMTEYYDFNSYQAGQRPGTFWFVENDNTSVYVDNLPGETDKSLAFEGSANSCFAQRSFEASPVSGQVFIEFDFCFEALNNSKFRIELHNEEGLAGVFMTMTNGAITLYDGTLVAKYVENKFYKLSIAIDTKTDKTNIWIDGKRRVRDISVAGKNYDGFKAIRLQLTDISSATKVNIDNYTIATGIERPTVEEEDVVTVDTTNAVSVEEKMKNAVAFYENRKYALINSVKTELDAIPFSENGIMYVPVRQMAQAVGGAVSYDAVSNSVTVKYLDNTYVFPCSGGTVTKNGMADNTISVKTKNDTLFIEVKSAAAVFEKYLFDDTNNGFVIFSNEQNFISWENNLDLLNDIVESFIYTDYSADELITMLKEKNPDKAHPRIMATSDDFARMRELIKTDAFMAKAYEQLITVAERHMSEEPQKYEIPDGIRLLNAARRVRERIAELSLAYNLSGDNRYAQRAWEEIYVVCYYPDWNESHFLDPSEMIAAFSIGYDWLYNWLTEEQRALMRDRMINYGLNHVMDDYLLNKDRVRTYHWSESDPANNWTFVCNGGMAMAALAIGDEDGCEDLCGQVLSHGLVNVRRILNQFSPSGSYREGPSYWSYATNYFSNYVKSLDTALGSDMGIFDVPGMRNTVEFVESMNGPAGFYNYSDAAVSSSAIRPTHMLWYADKLGKPYLATNRIKDVMNGDIIPTWEDIIFYTSELGNSELEMPLDKYSDVVETATMRSSYNDDALYVGFHNGSNSEHHVHYDKGGFIIDSQGERFFMDLGYDDYNLAGRTFDRYRYRAEGHNTLVFNPDGEYDQIGTANAKIVKFESKPKGAFAIADLTDIYANDVEKAQRGVMLNEGRTAVTVADEITMKETGEVWWFAHTDAEIEIAQCGKTAVLTKNGKKMKASILSEGTFEVMDAKPLPTSPTVAGQNENVGIRKLAIHLTEFKSGTIYVVFTNYYDDYQMEEAKPLSEWSISDGEMEYATVDEITVDGTLLSNFSSDVYAYSIEIPAEQQTVNLVESDGEVIDMRESGKAYGTVLVTNEQEGKLDKPYVITFERARIIGVPEGYESIAVAKYTASAEPQPENSAANAFDDSMDTRWAALGECSMDIDLGRVQQLDAVGVALWKGNQRTTTLKIEISADGESYETIFAGESCAATEDNEVFLTDGAEARYIRTTFYGTSEGDWNSILDIKALVKK